MDCAVVVTDHSWYDWAAIRERTGLIVVHGMLRHM
jgi:hypothetical protein